MATQVPRQLPTLLAAVLSGLMTSLSPESQTALQLRSQTSPGQHSWKSFAAPIGLASCLLCNPSRSLVFLSVASQPAVSRKPIPPRSGHVGGRGAPPVMTLLQTLAKHAMGAAEHGCGGERPLVQLLNSMSRVVEAAAAAFAGEGRTEHRNYSRERCAPFTSCWQGLWAVPCAPRP